MKRTRFILLVSAVLALARICLGAANPTLLREFITAQGDQLMEGKKPFRFVSANIPNLFYVEDNVAFTEENP